MTWDEYFFDLISTIKKKSKDPSTTVGCVIVSPDNEVVSTGFNGFPRGVQDNVAAFPERYERTQKLYFTEHSERNAIYAASKRGVPLDKCRLYLEWYPCADCMRAIIQVGITEVVVNGNSKDFNNEALYQRWKASIDCALLMAQEAGIQVRIHKTDDSH